MVSRRYLREVLTRLPHMTNRQAPEVTPEAWAFHQDLRSLRKLSGRVHKCHLPFAICHFRLRLGRAVNNPGWFAHRRRLIPS